MKIINAIKSRGDTHLSNLCENDLKEIKYHLKTCYKPYILKAKRFAHRIQEESNNEHLDEDKNEKDENVITPRVKRRKSDNSECVIWQQRSYKTDYKLYRICEQQRAEVLSRCSLHETINL